MNVIDEKVAEVLERIGENEIQKKDLMGRFDRQEAQIKTELDAELVGRCLINRRWNGSDEKNWEVLKVVAPRHVEGVVRYRAVSVPYVIREDADFGIAVNDVWLSADTAGLIDVVEDAVFEARFNEALAAIRGLCTKTVNDD